MVYRFEKETMEQYSFGEDVPVLPLQLNKIKFTKHHTIILSDCQLLFTLNKYRNLIYKKHAGTALPLLISWFHYKPVNLEMQGKSAYF